jgi:flagellar motility protein MotE (MotC chaperone)
MGRFFSFRFLLLPLIIIFGVLTLGLRVGDVWQAASSGQFLHASVARAEDTKPADTATPAASPSPPAVDAAKPADASAQGADAAAPASSSAAAPAPPAPSPSPDANVADDTSPAEMEVLKQLANRRDQLDKRGQNLDKREALIKVYEQRVDQKIKEMESIRLQLQQMVDQINGAQQTQLENLVKIYETMKPADAAKIFETLDMPTLLGVVQRMKPKSTAPIMAAMAPEKAKQVTVALSKQDQIPQAK